MTITNSLLIALIASVSIGESLAGKTKLYCCVKQQGKASVVIRTKKNGSIKNMLITGRPRKGKSVEFDNIVIDKSKRCTGLKGDFWDQNTLDSNPYASGQYTLKENKSLKLKIGEGGNGFDNKNKGRVILYRLGNTVVGCGKLSKQKASCKGDKTEQPTKAPSASPTSAPTPVETTGTPTAAPVATTAAPVATTAAPVATTDAPVAMTDAPVAITDAPVTITDAPVTITDAPVTITDAPVVMTDAPVAMTDAPVGTTDAPVGTTDAPVATTGAPTRSPSPPPTTV